jgi:transposase
MALGGEAGARLAERLAMATSPDTLLRITRAAGQDAMRPATPRVLGVDDWAWRRGHHYGTALVDLERNRAVDLMPDQQAQTLAAWLRQHPGVEIVARDRAGTYANGVRQGAPGAIQVADRWHLLRNLGDQVADRRHLLRNLGDAVRALVERHGSATRRAAQRTTETQAQGASLPDVPPPPSRPPNAVQRASWASLDRRQARYEAAADLHGKGMSISRIAGLLGAERKTVRRWLSLGHAPSWRKPRRGIGLDVHVAYLEGRWNEGCRNAAQLWREVIGRGFTGRPGLVRRWATGRRRGQPDPSATHQRPEAKAWAGPTIRRTGCMLMADETRLAANKRLFIGHLLTEAPRLGGAITVAKRLQRLRRHEKGDTLPAVLTAADETPFKNFAAGLRRHQDAVQAALDLPWTTSPVEGQINRLKMIKRTMYGRGI